MPRMTPCTICGKKTWRSIATETWTPPLKICRECRQAANPPKTKSAPFRPELRICKQCGQVYAAHNPRQKYCNVECRSTRSNWGTRPERVASSAERGYGAEHRRERAKWKPKVEAGQVNCCLCGYRIEPGSKWHLDHTPDRSDYRGVAHASCNMRDGAARGNRRRVYPTLNKACATCGSAFSTIYPKQVYCSVRCRPKRTRVKRLRVAVQTELRLCPMCGAIHQRPKYCSDRCQLLATAVKQRNAYRVKAGIPIDAPLKGNGSPRRRHIWSDEAVT